MGSIGKAGGEARGGELERMRLALARVEATAQRMRFMAEASSVLASSMDYERTLRNVARLAVPSIADWCAVDILRNGVLERLAVEHADPARIRLAVELHEQYPGDPASPYGVHEVLRTGVSQHMEELPDSLLVEAAENEAHLELLRTLGLRSYIVAPLTARDRTFGAVTLVNAESGRRFVESDIEFVEDLARRAAVAIDNAQLVSELQETRVRLEEQSVELETQAMDLETYAEEMKFSADAMRENEALLAAVVENAPVGILIARAPGGRIMLGNAATERILRHPVLFSEGVSSYDDWHAEGLDGQLLRPEQYPLARVLATGEPAGPDELLYRRGDGTKGWVRIHAAPVHDAAGQLSAALVVVDDVDAERRAAETRDRLLKQVADERQLLRELFEHSPAVMALVSGPDHVFSLVNPTWERSVGKPGAKGRPFREVFPELAPTGLLETLSSIYQSGQPFAEPALPVPLQRWGSNEIENTYWNVVWQPLPHRADGTRDILLHAFEVTLQVRAREQLQGLAAVALAVQTAGSVENALQEVTERARTLVGAHQAVTSLTVNDDWAQAINAVSLSDKYAAWPDHVPMPDGSGIYAWVCQSNKAMRMSQAELEEHPHFRRFGSHAAAHLPMRGWLAVPLIGSDGGNLGLIQLSDRYHGAFTADDEAILVQVAQLASATIQNARLYEDALEASRTRTGFLATMSHELRTPLNAMIGYAELLQLGVPAEIPPAARGQVDRIRLAAEHLLQLIEEILTFSRVEAGRERVMIEAVALSDLADEVVAIIEPLARRKELEFTVDLHDADGTIETDPRKVRQILLNLLGNAVKFTTEGRIALRITGDGDHVVMTISDSGIGIDPRHRERIFEPFWQADTELHSRVGGTGLGLPVSRQFVELLGGTIEVSSEPGVGTEVAVRLPVRSH